MVELTHFYVEKQGLTGFSSETWADIDTTNGRIPAASLSANTKYLIVARMTWTIQDSTKKGYLRIQTGDDRTLASKSEAVIEFMYPGGFGARNSWLFAHSFFASSTPDDIDFQCRYETQDSMDWDNYSLFVLDLDAISAPNLLGTYYFDASDAGPTDAGGHWNNDANAFDGDAATKASRNVSVTDPLTGEGTTAPTSGDTIGEVWLRLKCDLTGTTGGTLTAEIEEDSVGGTNLLTEVIGTNQQRIREGLINPPSGGWTWQKINDLAISFSYTGTNVDGGVFIAEVLVYDSNGRGYHEDIQLEDDTTEYSTTASTTILAELPSADLGTDEHVIFGYARVDIGSAGRWYNHLFRWGGGAARFFAQAEGEDTDEQRLTGFAGVVTGDGSEDFRIYGTEEAANGNMFDGGAYLIALPSSLFADVVSAFTSTSIIIDGTETTIQTVGPYTPSVGGNHLVFGSSAGDTVEPTQIGGVWVEEGTTEIRSGDSAETHNQIWDDTKDREQQHTFQRYSISSQVTFNLRSQGAGADFDQLYRWLTVVNLNKPSAGVTEKYRQTRVVQGLVSADRRSA